MQTLTQWPSIDDFVLATDHWTAPFWAAASEQRLVVMRCSDCGRRRMPPSPFCPACRSQSADWPQIAGRGSIYTFTIVFRAVSPRQAGHLPYAPALIEFEDAPGIRLVSDIVDAAVDQIHVGALVDLVWHRREDGLSLPRFCLAQEG